MKKIKTKVLTDCLELLFKGITEAQREILEGGAVNKLRSQVLSFLLVLFDRRRSLM